MKNIKREPVGVEGFMRWPIALALAAVLLMLGFALGRSNLSLQVGADEDLSETSVTPLDDGLPTSLDIQAGDTSIGQ